MSQDYKFKFDEMRHNEPGVKEDSLHGGDTHVRKLKFIWPDGKSLTMNYAFLISHQYNRDLGQIIFSYTSDVITIRGNNLDALDEMLQYNIPKKIEIINGRYASLQTNKINVTDIVVEKKN